MVHCLNGRIPSLNCCRNLFSCAMFFWLLLRVFTGACSVFHICGTFPPPTRYKIIILFFILMDVEPFPFRQNTLIFKVTAGSVGGSSFVLLPFYCLVLPECGSFSSITCACTLNRITWHLRMTAKHYNQLGLKEESKTDLLELTFIPQCFSFLYQLIKPWLIQSIWGIFNIT